jgi:hypothetical protein
MTMIVEHWTAAADFELAALDTAGIGTGLFVYPLSISEEERSWRAAAWPNRRCILLDVPESVAREVQRFDAGEVGNPFPVVELFVPSDRFADVLTHEE